MTRIENYIYKKGLELKATKKVRIKLKKITLVKYKDFSTY